MARIERALSYIHCHLEEPLSVQLLASQSCWSRWQFQRVFTAATGFTVAQYIRELRLSRAAELLISTDRRQLDIALACGFDTDISFSRSFRQVFGCTAGAYRRRGQRTRMLAAINANVQELPRLPSPMRKAMLAIRVEHRQAFTVSGISAPVKGLFAPTPDFATSVPNLWKRLLQAAKDNALKSGQSPLIGVLDLTGDDHTSFPYWACLQSNEEQIGVGLNSLTVPAQDYAVIPHSGDISRLQSVLECFIIHWLPESGYSGVNGFDLEIYDHRFRPGQPDCYMEYWVPVTPR